MLTERIVIDNWQLLEEPFAAPSVFFGRSVESLLTSERTDGWAHITGSPASFFGDAERLAADAAGEQYLIWQLPRLRFFELEVYAQDAAAADALSFAAAARGTDWQELTHEVSIEERSADGWLRLRIHGTVPEEWEAGSFRLTLQAAERDGSALQLGRLVLTGQK